MPDERGRMTPNEFRDAAETHDAAMAGRNALERRCYSERAEEDETRAAYEAAPPDVRDALVLVAKANYEAERRRIGKLRAKGKGSGLVDTRWLDERWKGLVWREALAEWRGSTSYVSAVLRSRQEA